MANITKIGSIDFKDEIGICDVIIYNDETNKCHVPHFHIKSVDGKFETAICLDKPAYYDHDGITGRLNDNQRKILNDFMKVRYE